MLVREGIRVKLIELSADDLLAGKVDYDLRYAELAVGEPVTDARSVLGLLEHAADHVVVSRRPVPALAELPAVDDIADQEQRFAIGRFQEIEQQFGFAAGGAEMRVGNPDRAKSEPGASRLEMCRLLNPLCNWRPRKAGCIGWRW